MVKELEAMRETVSAAARDADEEIETWRSRAGELAEANGKLMQRAEDHRDVVLRCVFFFFFFFPPQDFGGESIFVRLAALTVSNHPITSLAAV
jgi:hypothetical protein